MSTKNEAAKSYVKNWGELPSEFHAYELEMIYQTGWESALANAPEVKELVEFIRLVARPLPETINTTELERETQLAAVRILAAFDARGKSE